MSAAGFRPDVPFNELPALPPAVELEGARVLKACISARAALAELNVASELIPNPTILINTIPILEARASSEIENIVTTNDRLFEFAADEAASPDPETKEALRYRTALRRGYDLLAQRPVSTNLAIEVCTVLRGIETDVRRIPGTSLRHTATGDVVYTPPDDEERLRRLLTNWERFLHDHEHLDPLVRLAVGHYQFEAIHPFLDGNGRTGRILNLLFLVEQKLLRQPILYMSGAIIRSKNTYYRLLLEITTSNGWEAWLLYMLDLVEDTSHRTIAKIRAMRTLLREAAAHVRARAPKIYSRELVELIFEQPYCRIANVVHARIAKRQTAADYLATLADIGVLTPVQGGREKLFIHRSLLDLLSSDTHEASAYGSAPAREATEDVIARTADVNRSGSLDEQLRFAIANRLLVRMTYGGSTRVVEPHDYGVHKGTTRLLAYQPRRKDGEQGRSVSGWRLLDVSKIEEPFVLQETFQGSRAEPHQHHYAWDVVYARVA